MYFAAANHNINSTIHAAHRTWHANAMRSRPMAMQGELEPGVKGRFPGRRLEMVVESGKWVSIVDQSRCWKDFLPLPLTPNAPRI